MKSLVVGAGPSLEKNLQNLNDDEFDYVICTDGAINKYLESGRIPDYVATLEDTPTLDKYYNTEIVRRLGEKITGCYISDRVSANVLKSIEDAKIPLVKATKPNEYLTSNVGLFSWMVSFMEFGCNEIYLIGMDHCYPEGGGPPVPRDSEIFKYGFQVLINPYNKEEIVLHPAFQLWKEEFDYYSEIFKEEVKTFNLTGRGALYSKNIIWKPDYQMKN